MTEPQAPPTLRALVHSFELKGTLVLGDLQDHPALVHCGEELVEQHWGFETRAVSAPWDARIVLAMVKAGSTVSPELMAKAGAVYAIAKRPGGPFPDRIGVGRTRTADISLRAASVSKYHAYFTHDDRTGAWLLVDARSRNGTRVSDSRIEPGVGKKLENGTQIMFGDETFLFFTARGFRALLDSLIQRT